MHVRDGLRILALGLVLGACGSAGSTPNPTGSSGSAASAGAGGLALNLAPPAEGSDQYLKLCARYGLGNVRQLALSPDGSTVLIGGNDLAILYARSSGEALRHYPVEGTISAVAFSPDGETLAATTGTRVYLFEVGTGTLIATVEWPSWRATGRPAVAFSPDGTQFALADESHIGLYSRATLVQVRDLDVQFTLAADRMAYAPGTSELLVRTLRGVDAIDTSSGATTQLFAMPAPKFNGALAVSAGGLVAASDDAGNISLWRRGESEPLFQKSDTGATHTLAISNDGLRVAAIGGMDDGELSVWDVATGSEQLHQNLSGLWADPAGYSDIASVRFSLDGTQVLGNDAYQAHSFDVSTGQELKGYSWGHVGKWAVAAASPDQRLLASAARDGIFVWDRSSERIVSTWTAMIHDNLVFSSDSQRLYSTSGGVVFEWDPQSGSLLRQSGELSRSGLSRLATSPDGKSLLTGVSGQEFFILSTETLEPTLRTPAVEWKIVYAVFSPDSASFVAGLSQEEIGVWDARSGALTARFKINTELGHTLFAAGGTRLVVEAGTDGLVFAWPELTLLHRLQRHTATISLTLAVDDQHVMSFGGDEGRIVLWDILTGQAVSEGAMDYDFIPRIGLPSGMSIAVLKPSGNAFRIHCSQASPPGVPLSAFGVPR